MRSGSAMPATTTTTATYPYDAVFPNDSWAVSIMSYFDQAESTYYAARASPALMRDAEGGGHHRHGAALRSVDDDAGRRHDLRLQLNAGRAVYNASLYPNTTLHHLRLRRHRHPRLFGLTSTTS